jgi:hypothetical protein
VNKQHPRSPTGQVFLPRRAASCRTVPHRAAPHDFTRRRRGENVARTAERCERVARADAKVTEFIEKTEDNSYAKYSLMNDPERDRIA